MNKMYLVKGDWSDDGHGKTDKVLYEVNYPVDKVQQAYKDSCKKLGISFNDDGEDDYTGIKITNWSCKQKHHLFTDGEDWEVSDEVLKILRDYNCPLLTDEDDLGIVFEDLWWWFVSLSLEGLTYEEVEDNIPCINGYWNADLNVQFGYGLYYS